jgi:hypothetical protein
MTIASGDYVNPGTGPHRLDVLPGLSNDGTLSRVAALSRGEDLCSVSIIGPSSLRNASASPFWRSAKNREPWNLVG